LQAKGKRTVTKRWPRTLLRIRVNRSRAKAAAKRPRAMPRKV
jgi:hypothetical protein